MRNGEYLTSNSDIAWPFVSDTPQADSPVFRFFSDGGVTLTPDQLDAGLGAGISNVTLRVSGAGISLSFRAYVGEEGAEDYAFENVEMEIALDDFTVVQKAWFFLVVDGYSISSYLKLDKTGIREWLFALPFDPAALDPVAEDVKTITLVNHEPGTRNLYVEKAGISGDVRILQGNNVKLETSASETTDDSPAVQMEVDQWDGGPFVLISAGPGYGRGIIPCAGKKPCPDRNRNLPQPIRGNIIIEGDDCFQVTPEPDAGDVFGNAPRTIHLYGRCTACCQCEAYVEANNQLADQSQIIETAKDELVSAADEYNSVARAFSGSPRNRPEWPGNFIVKCVAAAQNTKSSYTGAVDMGKNGVKGTISRGQGVITIINASQLDLMYVKINAMMDPQELSKVVLTASKNVYPDETVPTVDPQTGRVIDQTMDTESKVFGCNGEFEYQYDNLRAGSSLVFRVYGGKKDTTEPAETCHIWGYVEFYISEENLVSKSFNATIAPEEIINPEPLDPDNPIDNGNPLEGV